MKITLKTKKKVIVGGYRDNNGVVQELVIGRCYRFLNNYPKDKGSDITMDNCHQLVQLRRVDNDLRFIHVDGGISSTRIDGIKEYIARSGSSRDFAPATEYETIKYFEYEDQFKDKSNNR